MMSRHFALSSDFTGAIAKRLPHAINQLSVSGSLFHQFVTEIYIYTYTVPGQKYSTTTETAIQIVLKWVYS